MNTLLATNKLDITVAGLAICRALELTIDPGQCWGILGKNGSGKTTFRQCCFLYCFYKIFSNSHWGIFCSRP